MSAPSSNLPSFLQITVNEKRPGNQWGIDSNMSMGVGMISYTGFDLLLILVSYRSKSISIMSGYGLDNRAIKVRSPAEAEDFSSNLLSSERLCGPLSLLSNGY
jgi:hypothetical protein